MSLMKERFIFRMPNGKTSQNYGSVYTTIFSLKFHFRTRSTPLFEGIVEEPDAFQFVYLCLY